MDRMKRVFITGNAGSGKTTLCNMLANRLNTSPVSLDQFVWLPGWKTVTPETFHENINPVLQQDTWVIEGVSTHVLKHADTVIFLDVSRATSYWRALKRNWRYLLTSRPELPENCPELLILPTLIRIIWGFKKNVRPGLIKFIEEESGDIEVYQIQSRKDLATLLAAVGI